MLSAAILLLQAEIPAWGGLGVGGALAGVIFWFYVKREREIVATLTKFTDSFQRTVERNATAMTEVTAGLRELMDFLRDDRSRDCERDVQQRARAPGD